MGLARNRRKPVEGNLTSDEAYFSEHKEVEADVFTAERLEQARCFAETVIPNFERFADIDLTIRILKARQASPVHDDTAWILNAKVFLASVKDIETKKDVFDLLYFRTRDLAENKRPLLLEDVLIMLQAVFRLSFGQFRRIDDLKDFGSLEGLYEPLKQLHQNPNMTIDDFSTKVEPSLRLINIFFLRMHQQGVRQPVKLRQEARGKYS